MATPTAVTSERGDRPFWIVNGVVSVAGSISFPLTDYSITAPNVGGFIVSIEDHGALEFAIDFTKS